MSKEKPRNVDRSHGSSLRTAIRCLLASSALFIASDTVPEAEMPTENYDYLYEGIKIVPKGSPKPPHRESDVGEKNDESNDSDSDVGDTDFCLPGDCQFG